jgi:hypothetical protein
MRVEATVPGGGSAPGKSLDLLALPGERCRLAAGPPQLS